MAEEKSDIKMWAALTAQVSVAYSIICIGVEFITAADLFTDVGMLITWIALYLVNIWINLVFSGKSINWGKSDIVMWFGITSLILIIRLACTNYSHLSIGVWVFTIIVNIYMLFVLFVILTLSNKMDNPTTDRSSLTSDPDNNIIISATADESNIEDLSDNLRSAIGSYHSNLHNESPSGGVLGSSSRNLNCDSQIVFGTAPTLDNLNDESQNDLATAPSYGVFNTDSQNLARSGDINNIFNASDPPPSYDDVMTRKNEKEKV